MAGHTDSVILKGDEYQAREMERDTKTQIRTLSGNIALILPLLFFLTTGLFVLQTHNHTNIRF